MKPPLDFNQAKAKRKQRGQRNGHDAACPAGTPEPSSALRVQGATVPTIAPLLSPNAKRNAQMQLTRIEGIALKGIAAQDREAQKAHQEFVETVLKPVQDQFADLAAEVEQRLGLDKGSIGSKYLFDIETLSLVEKPEQPAPAEPAAE